MSKLQARGIMPTGTPIGITPTGTPIGITPTAAQLEDFRKLITMLKE